ncbi:CoB--CoM heterodisulfide reductase [Chlorobaculum parvum NCIB 8327]|uniref:CoB--CoM heterodisulfide reductase n=1 Tax=Chlorobaculum parvum (strain DSM 263 / NCIMB 8327) TaxID=517417 RepID=B3QN56_CHLP8|nr:heterodisulfide reductase-related iron-sulfur binding cluster [Chlorobaculum parvum]ACF11359.1 CoB--CoM heterodisulfide reductase [Chlorobaculum parvum NCIB 8327]
MEHTIRTDSLKQQLENATGNNYACCYQCGKCTAGCPAGGFMDNPPARIMRLIQAGYVEEAMRSDALWYCIGCMTCTSRCPQNMEIAGTMDALREMALKSGIVSSDKSKKLVTAFHTSFLNTVRKSGRLQELALVNSYKLRTRTLTQDVAAGFKMMKQGKINPVKAFTAKEEVENKGQIEKIFQLSEKESHTPAPKRKPVKRTFKPDEPIKVAPGMTVGYYPGCSLSGTAKDYDISIRRMCDHLGIKLREIEDWNCCGASSAHATNHKLSMLLPARNQALADQQGLDYVLTPCAACLNRQVTARKALKESEELREELKSVMGYDTEGKAQFIGVMQLLEGMDPEEIKKRVTHPLKELPLACYYGCLLVRPFDAMGYDDPENPTKMESIVEALGAKPVDWGYKVECCGAGLTMAQQEMIEDLTHKIARNATNSGAGAYVVACPLCHANLDMRQESMRKRYNDVGEMPVYYISDLVALACGASPEEVALDKHFVQASDMVRNL